MSPRRAAGIIKLIVSADAPVDDQRAGAGAAERAVISARRHSSGSGIAIIPARSTARNVSTHSTLLASCRPMIASERSPIRCNRPGKGRNHVIGLRIGQGTGRNVSDAPAVRRIDQRNRVRTPRHRATKQVVEGRAPADARAGRFSIGIGQGSRCIPLLWLTPPRFGIGPSGRLHQDA
jgi:hypothetical protein